MRVLITSVLFLFVALSSPVLAQDQAIDDPEGAMVFIRDLAGQTQEIWSDNALTRAERTKAFVDVFEAATDVKLIGQLILGRHYRNATPAQREAYLLAIRSYILNEFDKRMAQVGFRELEVTGTTPASGRRGHLFVRTSVKRDEGDPILADWRVRKSDGQFQIVNLEVEGINLVITNREFFATRVKAVGLDGLISELEEAAIEGHNQAE